MRSPRRCSRNGCPRQAVATLTYIYSDQTAVVGPLAGYSEPHTYDLCEPHARGLTTPRGWELVRHDGEYGAPPPIPDDLTALAEAVWDVTRPAPRRPGDPPAPPDRARTPAGGRRSHLRVIPPVS